MQLTEAVKKVKQEFPGKYVVVEVRASQHTGEKVEIKWTIYAEKQHHSGPNFEDAFRKAKIEAGKIKLKGQKQEDVTIGGGN